MYECNMFSSTGKARFNYFSSHYTTDMNTRISLYLFLRAMLPCNKLREISLSRGQKLVDRIVLTRVSCPQQSNSRIKKEKETKKENNW